MIILNNQNNTTMKKAISILTLAVLMLGITACSSGSDDDVMTRTFETEMLSNSVNISQNTSEKVTSGVMSIKWDITNSKMTISYPVQVSNDRNVTLALTDVDLNADNTLNCYTFTAANGGNGITDVTGYYDPQVGALQVNFVANGTHRVYNSTMLRYPYMTCKVTPLDGSSPAVESSSAGMAITIDPSDMSARMAMGGFSLTQTSGAIPQMTFYGLHAEATATGYKVTYNGDQHSTDGTYILNNFEAEVTNGGRAISGTFVINGNKYEGTFSGTEFAK